MRVIARFDREFGALMFAAYRGRGEVVNLPSDKYPDKSWAVIDN